MVYQSTHNTQNLNFGRKKEGEEAPATPKADAAPAAEAPKEEAPKADAAPAAEAPKEEQK